MKTSLNWIRKYLDFEASPEEISQMLTTIGLEVEGFEEVQSIKGGLKGVIVGQVKECIKHPDADKLSVTKVDLGTGELHQIVCGAPNVAAGQKVMVATIGTTIYPTNGEPFIIKKAKIRGVESNGMICAGDELGINSDHSGILVLPEDTKIGLEAAKYFEVLNDIVYEIGLTPNRSDATCHLGVARDLYAYVRVNKDNTATLKEPSASGFNVDSNSLKININLKRPDLCLRYAGLTISGITVKESPAWLQNQLKVIGVKSINNIVDITNYILHEMGQPLHAFDADEIDGKTINVDTLPKGYKFTALDGKIIELSGEELMICDGNNQGMCIGGVYGGLDSGVTNKTTSIFLESAHFSPKSIRKTSMYHNLRTDAAKVFEKGSNPNICITALKRAAMMIVEIAGGHISSDVIDIYPTEITPKEIHIKYENINNLLGIKLEEEKVHDILNALDMRISPVDDFGFKVYVPTNKSDVIREVDVIEEILRIYGFNQVPLKNKLSSTISYAPNPNKFSILNTIADFLASNGFNEIMGLSLIESKLCKEALDFKEEELVYINNTSNVGLDVMRPSLMLSGLLSILYNINRQQTNLKLFEIGKSYLKKGDDFTETEQLTLFLSGSTGEEHWSNPKPKTNDYYAIKQISELVLTKIGIRNYTIKESESAGLMYGLSYFIGEETVLTVGEISTSVLKKIGIKQPIFYGVFDIKVILKNITNKKNYVEEISRFPAVKRDLAIIVDKKVNFKQIQDAIGSTKQKHLKDIGLFDIYINSEVLGENKKSYALNFTFEDLEKTLTDKEIEAAMSKIMRVCEEELGAIIRKA